VVGFSWDDIDIVVTELDPTDSRLNSYRKLATII
jgi:hypothetical protein